MYLRQLSLSAGSEWVCMLNAWDCLYDVELCGTSMPDKKTREFSKNRRQLIHCAVGRGAKYKCCISDEGVCNLVETVKDL
jgi:hypothetical protein